MVIDGLGGEEVSQTVNVQTGSIIGGRFVELGTSGTITSPFLSAGADTFGLSILAGSVTTGDANTGVVNFEGGSFANTLYHFVATARQYTIPGASGLNLGASGTRRASGLTVLGPSGTTYDWIAIGQR